MDLLFAISTGVVSGVVSAALLFVARALVIGHLIPWYHQLLYRGINVDGVWYASDFRMVQDFKLVIRQQASVISGDAELSTRDDDQSSVEGSREFSVEGRIQDRYITLTLSHKNRQRIGVIALLLEPVCDGRELRGQMAFVSIRNSCIDSVPMHLAREKGLVIAERKVEEAELKRLLDDNSRQGKLPLKRRARSKKPANVPNDRVDLEQEAEPSGPADLIVSEGASRSIEIP